MNDRARLSVSAHAIRRYLERTPGLDEVLKLALDELGANASDYDVVRLLESCQSGLESVRAIRRRLGAGTAKKMYDALGDGRYPAAGGFVQVRDGNVVTFRKSRKP